MTQEDEEDEEYELYFPLRYPRVENDVFDTDLVSETIEFTDYKILENLKKRMGKLLSKVIIFEGDRYEIFAETEERLIEKEIQFYDKRRREEEV
jgi:hypothetical protein